MPDWREEIRRRLAALGLEPAREEQVVDELAQHLEDRYVELRARGTEADEARRAVLAEIGDEAALQRALTAADLPRHDDASPIGGGSKGSQLRDLLDDLRFGLRVIRKTPVVSAVVILALALGIGANTAIFSVVDAVLLRPLPFAKPDELVRLYHTNASIPGGRGTLSAADFLAIRDENRTLDQVAVYSRASDGFSFSTGDRPEQVFGSTVSANFFSVLGARPLLGRAFAPGDDAATAPPAVVLSYEFWQRRLGGDPRIVGRVIKLQGRSTTIIGVMPSGFWFPRGDFADFWLNLTIAPPTREGPFGLTGLARRRAHIGDAQLQSDLTGIANRVRTRFAFNNGGDWTFVPSPLQDELVRDMRPALLLLMGAVALVLLIACVNVTNLLLARASAREQEIAVRLALGAGRARIVRQLLAESALMALFGAAGGLALARWGTAALVALGPPSLALLHDVPVGIDGRVLIVTILVALGSCIVFGVAPAILGSRTESSRVLNEAGRSGMESRSRQHLRSGLVVAESALAVMLLVGAGLLLRTLAKLESVSPGVRTEKMLTVNLSLPPVRYQKQEAQIAFVSQLIDAVRTIPGVTSVGSMTGGLPPDQDNGGDNFAPEGMQLSRGTAEPVAGEHAIEGDYFPTFGIPLIAGRVFDVHDANDSFPVVIVSERLARRFFGTPTGALGRRMRLGGAPDWWTVVGVVGDAKYAGLARDDEITMYLPFRLAPGRSLALVVRSAGDPMSLVEGVRTAVSKLDGDVALARVRTMDQLMSQAVAQARFRTVLLTAFAAVAALLATIGIYGVMSYSVSRRVREIGVRMALGAQAGDVIALVVRQGAMLALSGVGIGLVGALAFARLTRTLLFGVGTADPLTFAVVALGVGAVALCACYLPARRASRVDPLLALRSE